MKSFVTGFVLVFVTQIGSASLGPAEVVDSRLRLTGRPAGGAVILTKLCVFRLDLLAGGALIFAEP